MLTVSDIEAMPLRAARPWQFGVPEEEALRWHASLLEAAAITDPTEAEVALREAASEGAMLRVALNPFAPRRSAEDIQAIAHAVAGSLPVPAWLSAEPPVLVLPDGSTALLPQDVLQQRFRTVRMLPGYEQDEVDDFLDTVVRTLRRHLGDPGVEVELLATDVAAASFTGTQLRDGYDRDEVDLYLARIAATLAAHEEAALGDHAAS